jgi:hypothetical protein
VDQSQGVRPTALAHYHSALSYFLGGEALAVGHLFMAVEALREPTLAAYCAKSGRSEQDIMEEEGHETAMTCWLGRGVRSYLRTPDNLQDRKICQ